MNEDGWDWAALAKAVKARRRQQRLPQDLVDRGGPGEMTMRKIERGEPTSIRPKTKVQLEQALNWPDGIVDRILDGTATQDELASAPKSADSEPLHVDLAGWRPVPLGQARHALGLALADLAGCDPTPAVAAAIEHTQQALAQLR